jgi:hypothetical protein
LPIEVDKPKPTRPPAGYLEPCASQPSDGSMQGELYRLDQLVRCERADKTAIKVYYDNLDRLINQPGPLSR